MLICSNFSGSSPKDKTTLKKRQIAVFTKVVLPISMKFQCLFSALPDCVLPKIRHYLFEEKGEIHLCEGSN